MFAASADVSRKTFLVSRIRFWWLQILFPGREPAQGEYPLRDNWLVMSAGSLVLTAVMALLLLPQLSHPLLAPDETRYAEIAREMSASGDWIVPTRQGVPYLDKPPMLYWLTALSFRLFGINEITARLATAAAAWGTVIATFWLGVPLVGRRGAGMGSLLVACSAGFLISGRFLFMDTLLTLFTTVSLLAGYTACHGERVRWNYWLLAAASCGMGLLTKGPVAAVLCLPPLFASQWLAGSRVLRLKHWLSYAGLALALAIPWFIAMELRRAGFLEEFFWKHHVQRVINGLAHEEPWWFYVPVVLIGLLPGSILFPAFISYLRSQESNFRDLRPRAVGDLLLSAGWIIAVFSLSRCKLPPYLLPIIPPICLAVGRGMEAILATAPQQGFLAYVRQHSPRDLAVTFFLGAVGSPVLQVALMGNPGATTVVIWCAIAGICAALAWCLENGTIRRIERRWTAVTVVALLGMGFGVGTIHSQFASRISVVEPVAAMARNVPGDLKEVVCFSLGRDEDGLAFSLHDCRVQAFTGEQLSEAVRALRAPGSKLLLADAREVNRISAILPETTALVTLGRHEHVVVAGLRDWSMANRRPPLPQHGPTAIPIAARRDALPAFSDTIRMTGSLPALLFADSVQTAD